MGAGLPAVGLGGEGVFDRVPAPMAALRVAEFALPARPLAAPLGVIGAHPVLSILLFIQVFLLLLLLVVLIERRFAAQRVRAELAGVLGVAYADLPPMSLPVARGLLAAVEPLAWRNAALSLEAMYDDLTGMYRRGAGMALLAREMARCDRSLLGRLTVAFVDVNGLKAVNDVAGHAAGDLLLTSVAGAITRRLRQNDLSFRYGGDEFVCVFPDLDVALATRVMTEIAAGAAAAAGRDVVSFGVAPFRQGETPEALVGRADAALYAGRRARN